MAISQVLGWLGPVARVALLEVARPLPLPAHKVLGRQAMFLARCWTTAAGSREACSKETLAARLGPKLAASSPVLALDVGDDDVNRIRHAT